MASISSAETSASIWYLVSKDVSIYLVGRDIAIYLVSKDICINLFSRWSETSSSTLSAENLRHHHLSCQLRALDVSIYLVSSDISIYFVSRDISIYLFSRYVCIYLVSKDVSINLFIRWFETSSSTLSADSLRHQNLPGQHRRLHLPGQQRRQQHGGAGTDEPLFETQVRMCRVR